MEEQITSPMAPPRSAGMTAEERVLIEEPLARILSRLDEQTSKLISIWADPIILLVGLLSYTSRVMSIAREKAEKEKESQPKPPPSEAAIRSNGGTISESTEGIAPPPPFITRHFEDDRL